MMRASELRSNGKVLVAKCYLARGFFSRFLGLMGRKQISGHEGILFPKCNSIHTFFMRFPIDVLLISPEGQVVEVKEALKPWRMLMPRKGVKHVVELRSRLAKELGIQVGAWLKFPGVWE